MTVTIAIADWFCWWSWDWKKAKLSREKSARKNAATVKTVLLRWLVQGAKHSVAVSARPTFTLTAALATLPWNR